VTRYPKNYHNSISHEDNYRKKEREKKRDITFYSPYVQVSKIGIRTIDTKLASMELHDSDVRY